MPVISAPGEAIPEEEDDSVGLSPNVRIGPEALKGFGRQIKGMPLYLPPTSAQPRPMRFTTLTQLVAQAVEPTTLTFGELAAQRYEVLGELGLGGGNPNLDTRATELLANDRSLDPLIYGALDIARLALGRLLSEAATATSPVTVWAGNREDVVAEVGRTALWAERYLIADPLATALMEREPTPSDLTRAVAQYAELAPLIKAGIVVPVPEPAIRFLAEETIEKWTASDVARPKMIDWIRKQITVEGPTARSVIFMHVRDAPGWAIGGYYLHGNLLRETLDQDAGTVTIHYLHPYDPNLDYRPWIRQSVTTTAGNLIRDANVALAAAHVLGAEYLTRSPFEARLLTRKGAYQRSVPQELLWLGVPYLSTATPDFIAKVATDDEKVDGLRKLVSRTRSRWRDDPRGGAEDLVSEIEEEVERLAERSRIDRAWSVGLPAALGTASIALSTALSTSQPALVALGAVAATAAGLAPAVGTALARGREPAWVFWAARRHQRDTQAPD